MGDYYTVMTHRVEMVLGPEAMERLAKARVIIFGVGGVGSWCAEGLVRSGITELTLVDSDIVCPTNVNRQLQATSLNLGQSKVKELRKRLLDINPGANIIARHEAYDGDSASGFGLAAFDYVVDAIDSITNKALLLEKCVEAGVTVFSSMGAAARTDPSKIKTGKLSKTHGCPLARNVRKRLRDKKVPGDFLCVYSDEPAVDPAVETICGSGECACVYDRDAFCGDTGESATDWCSMKKRVNGALVHITAIFGFTLAGLVIDDIAKGAARRG